MIEESQKRVAKLGRRNYKKVLEHGRKTMIQNSYETGMAGSKAENICRGLLGIQLPIILGEDYYSIIGINDKSIIAPFEIDIPVVVIEKRSEKIYKFAVEFNGTYWHKNDQEDERKRQRLIDCGWQYIALNHNVAVLDSKYKEVFEDDIEYISNMIKRNIAEKNR
ncbi:MAG: hypothetical protein R3Y24_09445 [Eubacteriales bacterium]